MDTKRIFNEECLEQYYCLFQSKYRNITFDAILCADDNAFQFLLKHDADLFPSTPIVFCGINNFDHSMIENKPFYTGVLETLDIKPTIDVALRLHPETATIAVVSDGTETGLSQRGQIKRLETEYAAIRFVYLNGEDLTLEELLQRLRALPKNSIVLAAVFTQDKTGAFFKNEWVYPRIYSNTQSPVYGFDRLFLGKGIMGGKLNWGGTQGEKAAQIILRILEDNLSPRSIPVFDGSLNTWMFDSNQLRQFGIQESKLPDDSIVINRLNSFYTINKTVFVIIVSLIIISMSLMSLLILDLNKRRRMEKSMRESNERINALFQNTTACILFIEERVIKYVNQATLELFGYSEEEICGQDTSLIHISKEKYEEAGTILYTALQEHGFWHDEWPFRKKNGDILWMDLYISLMPSTPSHKFSPIIWQYNSSYCVISVIHKYL